MCIKSKIKIVHQINTKLFQLICLIFIFISSIVGCKKDSETEQKPDDFGTGYYWTTGYSDSWTDIFIGKDGNSVFYRTEESVNLKKAGESRNCSAIMAAILIGDNKYTTPIFILNNLGLPRTISINDCDLIFCYNPDNTISLAITNSTGFVASIRDIEPNSDLSSLENSDNLNDANGLWKKIALIKSVVGIFNSELYNKVPDVAEALNLTLQVFKNLIPLKGTDSFNIKVVQTIAYLGPSDLATVMNGAEILWDSKLNASNVTKALKILCIDFKTKELSEVTNETAKYDLESYSIIPNNENIASFDYKIGIRYCLEDYDPTKEGDKLDWSFTYYNTASTNDHSFKLTGLKSQKKYKYCAFIQYDDFIDCFEVKTFEPVYVNIESWEPTGSEREAIDSDHYLFTYSLNQDVLLSGDLDFVEDLGYYSYLSGRYIPLGTFISGINSTWLKVPVVDQDYLEYSVAPYVLFKNGQYYKGASVTRHLSYGLKNASINNRTDRNVDFIETSGKSGYN